MSDKFYVLWCPTFPSPPRKQYSTPEQAHAVAKEMATKQLGDEFHVLECIASYKAEKPVAPKLIVEQRKETKKAREEREANLAKEVAALKAFSEAKPPFTMPNQVIGSSWQPPPSPRVQAAGYTVRPGYKWITAVEYKLGTDVYAATRYPNENCPVWTAPKKATSQPEADTWAAMAGGWYYLVKASTPGWPVSWDNVYVGQTYEHPQHGKFTCYIGGHDRTNYSRSTIPVAVAPGGSLWGWYSDGGGGLSGVPTTLSGTCTGEKYLVRAK